MKHTVRTLRSDLGALVLLALTVAAAWLIAQSRPRPPQLAQTSPLPTPTADHFRSPLPSPTVPPPAPAPSPTPEKPTPPTRQPPQPTAVPTQVGQRVPFCTFPGGAPPEREGPGLEQYEFSEPRVVLTNTASIAIADWLPDNNRLLVTRSYPQSYRERIETLDIRTGELQLYAERDHHNGMPVWLSAIQGVAYSTVLERQLELRVGRAQLSRADPIVVSEGNYIALGFSLAVEPGGRHLMYLVDRKGGRPQIWDSVGRTTQAAPFDVAEWRDFPDPNSAKDAMPRWSPNGVQLAVFAYPALFLVEPGPNRVCEVGLGSVAGVPRSALDSHWSPNARYLAMIATARLPDELVRSTDLVVLDVLTGAQRQILLQANRGNITDISWGSDSQHLVVLVQAAYRQARADHKLLLVDVVTGDVRPMLPKRTFGGSSNWGEQMAWSRNGRYLALECPILLDADGSLVQDGLCLISTEVRP